MFDQSTMIMTGGSGLLGGEIRKLLPEADYPSEADFNLTNYCQMDRYLEGRAFSLMLHAAAFVSPPKIDQDPLQALDVNIAGTASVVKLCMKHGLKLAYICTDYVFRGDRGNYTEDDSVYPVNKYAWSKLGGECAVRLYDKSLIIRTTFGPNVFPYDKAFTDQWTSREPVRTIARMIVALLEKDASGTVHVGGKRKTVMEYAHSLDPARVIEPLSINDVDFKVPVDTSLDVSRLHDLIETKE
ncbi:MAG: sugar nucleotide-binding protein [Candidatus Edwardsbacteria bacterium]|nr:sugar nucleotide-binding protein [Candidatus Edwardsbacteria bacterium]